MSRAGSVAHPNNREDPDAVSKLQSIRERYLKWKSEGWDNQMHWYSAKDLASFARNSKLFADEIYEVEITQTPFVTNTIRDNAFHLRLHVYATISSYSLAINSY
jgi:hypothetical protein